MTRAAPSASTHAEPPTRSAAALPSSCGIEAALPQEGHFLDPGRRRASASLKSVSTLRRRSAPPFISQPKSKGPVPKVSHQNRGGGKNSIRKKGKFSIRIDSFPFPGMAGMSGNRCIRSTSAGSSSIAWCISLQGRRMTLSERNRFTIST